MKVIIVDDDATTLRVVSAALQSRGHEVIERNTPIGTTLAIIREKPDVVLLDVRMPGLSGDKIASLVNQESGVRPIVILYSSLPKEELQRLVLSSGAAGAISKTGNPLTFLDEFHRVVGATRGAAPRTLG